MDKLRLYVWIALAAMVYICYFVWQQDYPPPTPEPEAATASAPQPSDQLPALPIEGAKRAESQTPKPAATPPTATPVAAASGEKISVMTDVFELTVSTQGGEIDR